MKKKIKKFWQWLCQTRYITIGFGEEPTPAAHTEPTCHPELVSGSLPDDVSKAINLEFEEEKLKRQTINFQKIFMRLLDFEQGQEFALTEKFLPDDVAIERALAKFQQAKREGRIDELNNIVQQEEITNDQH